MPPYLPSSRAIGSLITRGNGARRVLSATRRPNQFRCLSQIPGLHASTSVPTLDCSFGTLCDRLQKRKFLSCSDGEEGGVLSKVHEETRIMGYSQEQLFDVVAAVDLYHGFVPWCQRSEVLKHNPDGSFEAELEIGFKFFVESYVSHVELKKPQYVKTTALDSNLFDHLINTWEFNPGPVEGTCELHFLVDFKFRSPLYRQVASLFFKEVVSRMIESFSGRCRLIYGPGVRVQERTIQQRA
ncbi:hypothetical protein QQ045_030922 [Rhodiola kirilowii]